MHGDGDDDCGDNFNITTMTRLDYDGGSGENAEGTVFMMRPTTMTVLMKELLILRVAII
jgi:hypothetical protein